MKKTKNILSVIIIVAYTALTSQSAHAQACNKGDNILGIGIGIGGNYTSYSTYSSQTPAIALFYDHISHLEVGPGALSFGAYVGYKSLTYTDAYYPGYNYDWKWTYTI